MIKNQRGVTLIAIVISIIVMFILIGVGLNYVVGDRNYIETASVAAYESRRANVEEQFRDYVKDDLANGKDFFEDMVNEGYLKRNYFRGEGHVGAGYDAKTDTDFFVITEKGLQEFAPKSVDDMDVKVVREVIPNYDAIISFSYSLDFIKDPSMEGLKVFFVDRDLNVAYVINGNLYGEVKAKPNPFAEQQKWWATE